MTQGIGEKVSKRINSLRFLLIVFVVFIHNDAVSHGVNFSDGTEVYQIPHFVQKIVELVSCITSAAVPLFFIISSYLLYIKELTFSKNFKKKMKTLVLPYFLWNILTVLFFYAAQSFPFTKRYFATLIIRNFTAVDWIQAFIGKCTEGETLHTPFASQFWFLRDLIILNLLFQIIRKLIDRFPVFIFVSFLMLWISDKNIYIVNAGALFFFSLGYYIVKYNISYKHIDNIKTAAMLFMYGIIITVKLFFPEYVNITGQINIMAAVLLLIKASGYFVHNEKLYGYLNRLKEYAFFFYAVHMVLEAVLIKLSVLIIPMKGWLLLVQYFGVSIITVMILLIIGTIIRKTMPKIYGILTGGRT